MNNGAGFFVMFIIMCMSHMFYNSLTNEQAPGGGDENAFYAEWVEPLKMFDFKWEEDRHPFGYTLFMGTTFGIFIVWIFGLVWQTPYYTNQLEEKFRDENKEILRQNNNSQDWI
jgi:hypothetical protein